MYYKIKIIFTLTRFRLSAAVGLSSFVAYSYYAKQISFIAFLLSIGILFLASGASIFNQIQERKFDAIMKRTSKRPIPAGLITVDSALLLASVFTILGAFILFFFGGLKPMLLGIFSLLWYNLFYTYLKRKTAFAVFPGALTGVIPIIIGWTAAGGSWNDVPCLFISAFMVLWQIPHFMILMLQHNDDYKLAGFPVFTDFFSVVQVKRFISVWIICMSIMACLLVYFDILHLVTFKIIITTTAFFTTVFIPVLLFKKDATRFKLIFTIINCFMILLLHFLMLDR